MQKLHVLRGIPFDILMSLNAYYISLPHYNEYSMNKRTIHRAVIYYTVVIADLSK